MSSLPTGCPTLDAIDAKIAEVLTALQQEDAASRAQVDGLCDAARGFGFGGDFFFKKGFERRKLCERVEVCEAASGGPGDLAGYSLVLAFVQGTVAFALVTLSSHNGLLKRGVAMFVDDPVREVE
ncbi:hypothetical protein BGX38DRAFT_1270373 [Terfezia claveryi]|nr:hypothetical protein BGX38DRAFT_1270373 [Terfezia claveryi]